MLTIIAHWNAFIENCEAELNRTVAHMAGSGMAQKYDPSEFYHLYEVREKLACFTFYRDWLAHALNQWDPAEAFEQTKARLDYDIMDALSNPKLAQTHKNAMVKMRRDFDLPLMLQEDRVKA